MLFLKALTLCQRCWSPGILCCSARQNQARKSFKPRKVRGINELSRKALSLSEPVECMVVLRHYSVYTSLQAMRATARDRKKQTREKRRTHVSGASCAFSTGSQSLPKVPAARGCQDREAELLKAKGQQNEDLQGSLEDRVTEGNFTRQAEV